MQDYCAIHHHHPDPPLYAIHHTILVMATLCKGQIAHLLSITRGSTVGCSHPASGVYLFTPTITSAPESIRACLRVAQAWELKTKSKCEVDALGVITISRGCFERCCSNKKTPPYHSNLSFVTLRTRRPTLLRAPAYCTPSEASPRRRCGHARRFLRGATQRSTRLV